MPDRVDLPLAKQGRPPASLNGGHSLTARYAEEVYEIIRSLAGPENRPVRFREVWPKMVPKKQHSNEENWKKLTTERALKLLTQAGWIERTIEGYRDLGSQLYAFHAARNELEQLLDVGWQTLEAEPGGSGTESYDWLRRASSLSLDLAATLGYWLRAFDRLLVRRTEELGYRLPQPGSFGLEAVSERGADLSPGFRAGVLAAEVADGYLTPERENATGKSGLHEARAEGPLSYQSALARLGQRALAPTLSGGGPRPGIPSAEWRTAANAELLKSRRTARLLAPERREVLRAQRTAWQNELHVGYSKEFERDWCDTDSELAREEKRMRRSRAVRKKRLDGSGKVAR